MSNELEWPPVQPIVGADEPVPFPEGVLPTWLERFARAQAEETEVPVDMTAMLALAVVSAALQGRLAVRFGGWVEPVCLYTAIVMDSGERKSSVFNSLTAPLRDLEEEIADIEARTLAENAEQERDLERRIAAKDKEIEKQTALVSKIAAEDGVTSDNYRKEAADLDTKRVEYTDLLEMQRRFVKLYETQLISSDLTPEACSKILSEQRHSALAVMSSEGGVFEVLSGMRYNVSSNLDVFLKGHSGDDVVINRVGREVERVKRAILTLGLMVQPMVLEELGSKKAMAGKGLLARFAYSVPQSRLGYRQVLTEPVSEAIRNDFHESIQSIGKAAYDADEVVVARLSEEAFAKFLRFQKEDVELLFREDHPSLGNISTMREWVGKFAGLVFRISALHAAGRVRGLPTVIEEEDIDAGLSAVPYLIDHAYRAHSLMGLVPDSGFHRQLLLFLKKKNMREFRISELQQQWRVAKAMKAEKIEELLLDLMPTHYVRRFTISEKPPRYYWKVNESMFSDQSEAPVLIEEKIDA